MATSHYIYALLNIIFGSAEWVLIRYVLLRVSNWFTTAYPEYVVLPHDGFVLAWIHWGIFIYVFYGTAVYLWTQTERPGGV